MHIIATCHRATCGLAVALVLLVGLAGCGRGDDSGKPKAPGDDAGSPESPGSPAVQVDGAPAATADDGDAATDVTPQPPAPKPHVLRIARTDGKRHEVSFDGQMLIRADIDGDVPNPEPLMDSLMRLRQEIESQGETGVATLLIDIDDNAWYEFVGIALISCVKVKFIPHPFRLAEGMLVLQAANDEQCDEWTSFVPRYDSIKTPVRRTRTDSPSGFGADESPLRTVRRADPEKASSFVYKPSAPLELGEDGRSRVQGMARLRIDLQHVEPHEANQDKVIIELNRERVEGLEQLREQLEAMVQELKAEGASPEDVAVIVSPDMVVWYKHVRRACQGLLDAGFTRIYWAVPK